MIDDAQKPRPGSDAQECIARLRAGLVARYKLRAVPGRPEELEEPKTKRRVSIGYGSKTIRVRLQEGREWIDHADYQLMDPAALEGRVFKELTDAWFGYLIPKPPMRDNIA